jgi:hypothetical protein
MVLAVMWLAACASDKLAQAPPADVDFSGHWKLNEADSDDPQRLVQAQFNQQTAAQNDPSTGGSGGGGRGGRGGGGRGGAGGMGARGPGGPVMPSVGAMGEGLRWPGKALEVKQVAGVVAFISEGASRVCQPMDASGKPPHHHAPANDREGAAAPGTAAPGTSTRGAGPRDASPRERDAPPPRCGWAEKTLIVQGGDPDDDRPPFEEHYSLSDDKQRLVEVVAFKGGRSSGFTMSRVWDRIPQ